MKNLSKKSLSIILAITIIFSSAHIGFSELDFSEFFAVKVHAATKLFWPLPSNYTYASCVTSPYGYRTSPISGVQELHNGMDLAATINTPIFAAADGTVAYAGMVDSYGNLTVLYHPNLGVYTFYAHANSIAVSSGATVKAGDVIAYVGSTGDSTGNHLHFGICTWLSGGIWPRDFIDPTPGNGYNYTTVIGISTTGISLAPDRKTIDIGESVSLTATVSPSNATNKTVTWSSSDTSIVTVSSGTIKGVKAGVATITATASGGQTATCKVVVFPSTATPTLVTEYNGHLYELYDYTSAWKDAKEFCEAKGGHLVTITSDAENDVIYNLAQNGNKARYCLGATDEKTESNWLWVTGEDFSYSNFQSGENTDSTDYEEEDYLFMYTDNGQWGDVRNYAYDPTVNGFICEYESLLTYDNVTVIGNKVYELYEREYPITVATGIAESRGGHLVSLTSEEEQTALIAWIQANSDIENISIGANDAETEGVWQWYNGENWEFTSWVEGEPNDTNGIEDNAILILSSGKWNDVTRANAYSFVVEYDLEKWLAAGNDANDIVFNELPEGADPDCYELVRQYRYRDKKTITSTDSNIDGWELYDSKVSYSSWSNIQITDSKPTESDVLQIVETAERYKWFHYLNYYDGCDCIDSIPYGTNKRYCEIYLNYNLTGVSFSDQGGQSAFGTYPCDNDDFDIWFYGGLVTVYYYRVRTKTTTNYFYKYGDWSDWSETPITSTDNREVESRTVYVLKEHKHTYSDWKVETAVTCITDGLKSRTCTDCGDVETEVIPATGHQNTIWITEQEPNCTEDGYKDEYCLDCTELISSESIPATGHLNTEWKTEKEPSCDVAGYKDEYCLDCGEKVGTEEIYATGHSYSTQWTIDIAPTCTEEGSKSHHCTVCGDKTDVTVIDLLGHDYKVVSTEEEHPHTISYKCSRCSETKEETSTSADCAICNFSYTNVDDETCKITGYIGNENSFVMPGTIDGRTVTTTTTGAFKNNTTLTSVRIDNGVQGLGSLAFLGCTSLSKIVIPESVSSIGTNAFYNCADDFTIYCYRDTYAMQYAVDNSIDYVIMDVGETNNSIIDYKNELIYTFKKCITNLCDILNIPSTSMAFAEASHISGNKEFLGTGTKITVFNNDEISSEYTLVVEGDLNGDSVCDVLDCAQVALASNGFAQFSGVYLEAGDADDNGEIDVTDYQSIVNSALAS